MYRVLEQRRRNVIIGLLLLMFLPLQVFALKEDGKAILHITADSTIYNYKSGTKIFEGHVKLDQGTTHLLADKLITKNNKNNAMQEAIAYGLQQSAHYWTVPNVGEPEIHAHAKVIKFYPIDSNVVLEQNVVVTQLENSFKGELILYNMNDQTITVPASNKGHAVLVYNPDKKR